MLESFRTSRNSPTRVKQKSERRLQMAGFDALLRKYTGQFEGKKTFPAAGYSQMTSWTREGSVVAIDGCLFSLSVYSQGIIPCIHSWLFYCRRLESNSEGDERPSRLALYIIDKLLKIQWVRKNNRKSLTAKWISLN